MPDDEQNNPEGKVEAQATQPELPSVEPLKSPPISAPSRPVNHIALYALGVIAFGALAGVSVAAFLFHQAQVTLAPAPPPPTIVSHDLQDLGTAEAPNYGLKGHLTTQWTTQPGYSVTIEPADPAMAAGFGLAVNNPPHPLFIKVQLEDRLGYVMCSRDVLVKFPTVKPADLDQKTAPGKKPIKLNAKLQAQRDLEQADYDRAQALEQRREQGRDVFQNQLGGDGQVVSITAQGNIPCPVETYVRVAKWGFVPDFPTLDDQNELIANQPPSKESLLHDAILRSRRRMAYKSPVKALSFSLEGDDAVVDFDIPGGLIETRAGKTFMIDKSGSVGNTAAWQEYPAYFHYRCEQTTSSCTLARTGAGVMHAKLKHSGPGA